MNENDLLTKNEAYAIANLVDDTIFDEIRNDNEIDSLEWLKNVIHGYEKLCSYSGYVGATEARKDDSKWKSSQ